MFAQPLNFTVTVLNSVANDTATNLPIYQVHASSIEPYVIGKIYDCKVQGTLNKGSGSESIAESNIFTIEFDPC